MNLVFVSIEEVRLVDEALTSYECDIAKCLAETHAVNPDANVCRVLRAALTRLTEVRLRLVAASGELGPLVPVVAAVPRRRVPGVRLS